MRARYARGADRWPAENLRDAAGIREKFGVDPPLIPDLLALVGDAADGYPGIPGIGAKTAAQLLNRYGKIEKFPSEFSANNASSRCSSRNSRRCAPMRRSSRRSRRCAGAVPRRPSRSGRRGWKRRGCSSVRSRKAYATRSCGVMSDAWKSGGHFTDFVAVYVARFPSAPFIEQQCVDRSARLLATGQACGFLHGLCAQHD